MTITLPSLGADRQGVGIRFGAVVRELREGRDWSQEHLANRADLNRTYMGEIERGAAMPSLATAAKLAQALGLSLAVLIAHVESRTPHPAPHRNAEPPNTGLPSAGG